MTIAGPSLANLPEARRARVSTLTIDLASFNRMLERFPGPA